MAIAIYNQETEYRVRDDFEYHLGKRSLYIMTKYPDRIHQYNIIDDTAETHGSVRLRSIRVAQALTARGIGLNDVVMLSGPSHMDVCIPFIASLFIGATTFPIPEKQTKDEIIYFFKLSLPKIVFCQLELASIISEAATEIDFLVEIVVFGDDRDVKFLTFSEFSKPTGTEEDFKVTEFDTETTIAVISNSSGTTGLPKGTCLRHKQMALVMQLPTAPMDPDTLASGVMLSLAQQCWISSTLTLIMSCTLGQSRVLTPEFSTDFLLEAVKKTKPTTILMSPMAAGKLAAHPDFQNTDFSSVKLVMVVGSTISDELRNQLQKQIPNGQVNNDYGMTESAGPLCAIPQHKMKPMTVGVVLPWIQWRVVNVDTGEFLGPHEVGELQVTGDTIFKDYYKNPEATKAAFASDKWYKTGDLVYYDEENFIFSAGRLKEIIKWDLKQIAPAEIEHVIGNIEGVAAVCIVGIPAGLIGDLVLAFVEKTHGSKVTAQEIKDVVKDKLSHWKQLRGGVVFLDNIPLTCSGKVDRKYLNQIKSTVHAE